MKGVALNWKRIGMLLATAGSLIELLGTIAERRHERANVPDPLRVLPSGRHSK